MSKVIHYEVYADSVHGSDVVVREYLNEALKCAEDWSKNSDCPIIVAKVTTEVDCQYFKGQWQPFKK